MTRVLTDFEIRFCLENGIDLPMAQGQKFDDSPIMSRTDPFWIEGRRGFSAAPILEQIDVLMIVDSARFANAIVKLINAHSFAKAFGIRRIYHPGFDFLKDDIVVEGVEIIKGLPLGGNILKSKFFYGRTFRPFFKMTSSRYDVLRVFTPYLNLQLCHQRRKSDKELFIHLRSGDVFKKEVPHHLYGQPPFSFYKIIIEIEKWDRVILVYEDDSNPVISRLEAYLRDRAVSFESHSGTTKQDIQVLSKARELVIGRGNFIYPVLCLSKNIKKVFCFENDDRDSWGLQNSDISFLTMTDTLGLYKNDVLKTWKNTPEQNSLQLTYSEKNLAFK